MKGLNSRVFVPIGTMIFGLLWVFVGLRYHGWWNDGRAASGFFPVLAGGLLALISVLAFLSERMENPPEFFIFHLIPLLAAVLVVGIAMVVGFFPALMLYMIGWLRWYERYTWRLSTSITAITILAMYGVFSVWLRVPFPKGILVELIMR